MMPTTIKRAANEKGYGNAVVNSRVKNYANDPYFLKKAKEAKEIIKRVGLPGNKKK